MKVSTQYLITKKICHNSFNTAYQPSLLRIVRTTIHGPWTVNTDKETTALLTKKNEIDTFPISLAEIMTPLHVLKVKISWNASIFRPWFYCKVWLALSFKSNDREFVKIRRKTILQKKVLMSSIPGVWDVSPS